MKKASLMLAAILLASICAAMPLSSQLAYLEVWVDDDYTSSTPGWGIDHFDTIQEGIMAVGAGGTVHVAAGTYLAYTDSKLIFIGKNISLLGAGEDCTFVDGQDGARTMWTENLDSTAIIEGFTFENGRADGEASHWAHYGAGMLNVNSSPTVRNCTFRNNTTNSVGGGIYNIDSDPVIINCKFLNNTADRGGGIYNLNSSPTITNCTFAENTAEKAGGGINNTFSSPTITNCVFMDNSSMTSGGGIGNFDSSTIVTNCTFLGNYAKIYGAGIANESADITVTNCVLWGNASDDYSAYGNYFTNPYGVSTVTYSDVGGGCAGEGNIDADPEFSSGCRLYFYSPCIDSGMDLSYSSFDHVHYDIEGSPRPQGSGYDMGAYEYQGTSKDYLLFSFAMRLRDIFREAVGL